VGPRAPRRRGAVVVAVAARRGLVQRRLAFFPLRGLALEPGLPGVVVVGRPGRWSRGRRRLAVFTRRVLRQVQGRRGARQRRWCRGRGRRHGWRRRGVVRRLRLVGRGRRRVAGELRLVARVGRIDVDDLARSRLNRRLHEAVRGPVPLGGRGLRGLRRRSLCGLGALPLGRVLLLQLLHERARGRVRRLWGPRSLLQQCCEALRLPSRSGVVVLGPPSLQERRVHGLLQQRARDGRDPPHAVRLLRVLCSPVVRPPPVRAVYDDRHTACDLDLGFAHGALGLVVLYVPCQAFATVQDVAPLARRVTDRLQVGVVRELLLAYYALGHVRCVRCRPGSHDR